MPPASLPTPPWFRDLHDGLAALLLPNARKDQRRQARTKAINWGRLLREVEDAAHWMSMAARTLKGTDEAAAMLRAVEALTPVRTIAAERSSTAIKGWWHLRVGHRERNRVHNLLVDIKVRYGAAVTYRALCARTVAVVRSTGFSSVYEEAFGHARSEPLTVAEEIENLTGRVKAAARYRRLSGKKSES